MPVTYATRRSALALAQCRAFVARLQAVAQPFEVRQLLVVTTGDKVQDRPLSDIGGKGLFVKEIEEALLDGRADFAVHSIKDVPGELPPGLSIVCVPAREDPRDVLIAPRHRTLSALPEGARVGTSSLRRMVALHAARPDLRIEPLRGNVDTRLRRVEAGDYDAIVLARAGLVRLGLETRATEVLSPAVSLPAVGQGALGIECRSADGAIRALLHPMNDPVTARCVAAERGVLIALEGDCQTPLAAFAERTTVGVGDLGSGQPDPSASASGRVNAHGRAIETHDLHAHGDEGARLHLRAFVARPDGTGYRADSRHVPWPATETEAYAIGFALGRELAAAGA